MRAADEREVEAILPDDIDNDILVKVIAWAEDLEDEARESGRDEGYDDGLCERDDAWQEGHDEGYETGFQEGVDSCG